MSKFLVAFDFDHTVIDENSDVVVRDLLPSHVLNERLEALRTVNGWTDYMQEVFRLLKEFDIDQNSVRQCIVDLQPCDGMLELFDYLNGTDCEVIIVSDSNTYFIEEWLSKWELKPFVHRIFSNPAKFKSGLLTIDKYHLQDWCSLSSVNLCKGHILEEFVKERKNDGVNFDFVVYVGDGQNDVCPALKLSDKDLVFARGGMRLEQVLTKADDCLKAKLHVWDSGKQIVDVIDSMIR